MSTNTTLQLYMERLPLKFKSGVCRVGGNALKGLAKIADGLRQQRCSEWPMTGPKLANVIHAGIAPLFFSLAGCDLHQMPKTSRFCVEEKRQIPDVELKVRLLLDIEKRGGLLPDHMLDYAPKMPLSPVQGNYREQKLITFVRRNPLCCQLIEEDLRNPGKNYFDERYHGDSDTWGAAFRDGYFANFYIQYERPYVKIKKLSEDYSGNRVDNISVNGAYNCGTIRSIDYIFG